MALEMFEKHIDCVFPSVSEWPKGLTVAPHDHIRKPTWFLLLCFHREALSVVWLASVYLFHDALKVGLNDVWRFHLFVKVLKGHLVLAFFRHLRSCGAFQQPFAFGLVPFEQVSPFIPM